MDILKVVFDFIHGELGTKEGWYLTGGCCTRRLSDEEFIHVSTDGRVEPQYDFDVALLPDEYNRLVGILEMSKIAHQKGKRHHSRVFEVSLMGTINVSLDLICVHEQELKHFVSSFDLLQNCLVFDGKDVVETNTGARMCAKKCMAKVTSMVTPVSTLSRVARYHQRGWLIPDDELLNLAKKYLKVPQEKISEY